MRLLAPILLLAAVAAAALPFDERRRAPADGPESPPAATATATATAAPEARPRADVPRARCTDGVPGCAAISGRVVFVERVDPDGDGDLHVVVADGSVTAPGLSAVDVRPDLRPRRDPRVGDRVSAAGPVQTGSYGQSQIHALEFHARRG
jgi:hypothetical protein